MAKTQNDAMLDAALAYITSNCNEMIACSAEPTTYNEATQPSASSGYALADVAMSDDASHYTGPAAGDTSGRKITIDEQASLVIDASGTATHLALVGSVSSVDTLLYVTTTTSLALVAANQVTIPAWKIEMRDPT